MDSLPFPGHQSNRENGVGKRTQNVSECLSQSESVPVMSWKDWFKEPQYYQVGSIIQFHVSALTTLNCHAVIFRIECQVQRRYTELQ